MHFNSVLVVWRDLCTFRLHLGVDSVRALDHCKCRPCHSPAERNLHKTASGEQLEHDM